MSHICDGCGEVHDGSSSIFMFNRPVTSDGTVIGAEVDGHPSLRRTRDQCFVRCEIVLHPEEREGPVVGVVCWALVEETDYDYIRSVFVDERGDVPLSWPVNARLWNRVEEVAPIPNTHGTRIQFDVLVDDPTPYVSWVPPSSTLAARIMTGVTTDFWLDLLAKPHEARRRRGTSSGG